MVKSPEPLAHFRSCRTIEWIFIRRSYGGRRLTMLWITFLTTSELGLVPISVSSFMTAFNGPGLVKACASCDIILIEVLVADQNQSHALSFITIWSWHQPQWTKDWEITSHLLWKKHGHWPLLWLQTQKKYWSSCFSLAVPWFQIIIGTQGLLYFDFSFYDKCHDQKPLGEEKVYLSYTSWS